jgi:hypothetical protein
VIGYESTVLILRASHQRLTVIGFYRSPSEDVGWFCELAGISCNTDSNELLIKVASQRQRPPASLLKGLPRKCKAGMKPSSGVFFLNLPGVVAEDL